MFYNPQKSGKGVSKEQARSEMKPFFKFWEIFGRKFWYLVQLNCLYGFLCIPVITLGPATVALTQVMRKFVLEQPIFVFAEFFGAFKKNFNLRAVLTGIFSLIFFAAFGFSMFISVVAVNVQPSGMVYFTLAMNMASGVVLLMVNSYIYPQIACLNLKMPAMLKNAGILCIAGFKRNVVTVLAFIVTFTVLTVVLLAWPFLVIMLPLLPFAQLAFVSVFNAYPVIQRYIINPYYEAQGEKNPELPDYGDETGLNGEKTGGTNTIFTDLGGKENPIDKKKVKSKGKLIK
ncbi:MAG: YesL family protein [Oscillospiraceae bacterium]|nr:YesL family protein [Oscillospiraceae bacterium]